MNFNPNSNQFQKDTFFRYFYGENWNRSYRNKQAEKQGPIRLGKLGNPIVSSFLFNIYYTLLGTFFYENGRVKVLIHLPVSAVWYVMTTYKSVYQSSSRRRNYGLYDSTDDKSKPYHCGSIGMTSVDYLKCYFDSCKTS